MRKRRLFMIVIVFGVVAGVIIFGASGMREPEYGGKRLSEWIRACGEKNLPAESLSRFTSYSLPELDQKADDAVVHIGTNAVPYLLKWIKYERTARLHSDPKEIRAWGAVGGFRSLGPAAVAAKGELSQILNDPTRTSSRERAAQALACLGPDGLPPLLAVLTNQYASGVRFSAVESIACMGTNARPAVPVLIAHLNDTNEYFVGAVADALGVMRLEPELAVPALVERLQGTGHFRGAVIFALRSFGATARSAVPALLALLKDHDSSTRNLAAKALERIDRQALEKTGENALRKDPAASPAP